MSRFFGSGSRRERSPVRSISGGGSAGWRCGVAVALVAGLGCVEQAGAAVPADFTWSGASSLPGWSTAANWAGGAAPSGTVGNLAFPALASQGCMSSPAAGACYESSNDSSVTANSITVDDGAGYAIAGNPIQLGSGGITAAPAAADPPRTNRLPTLTLTAPLNLRAPQSWSITGGPNEPQLLVAGAVTDPGADPLTISLDQPVTLAFANADLGPVTVAGDGNPQDGTIQVGSVGADGTLSGGALNAAGGAPVSFTRGAGLFGLKGTTGPVSMAAGIVQVGESDQAGALAVAGGVSLDAQSELFAYINGPGTTPGADYSQLSATATIDLAGARLLLGEGENAAGVCRQLHVGDVDRLVSASSTVTGRFANAPDGATLSVSCFGSTGTQPTVMIAYPGDGVTATVLTAGTPPAPTTTTLTASPSALVTNQPVVLTATVTPGSANPDGTVEFFDHGGSISGCEAVPVAVSGSSFAATCPASFVAALPPSLSATYRPQAGSSLAGSDSATLAPAVARAPTTTTVAASLSTVGLGQPVLYTATVTPGQPDGANPSGSIVFLADGQPPGQGAAGSPGCSGAPLFGAQTTASASCRAVFTDGIGTRSAAITATYGGDANFAPSTSPPLAVSVVGRPASPAKTTPPGGAGRAIIGRARATATTADVVVTCRGGKGQRCTVALKLSTRERTVAGRIVSATAMATATKARGTERTVTVGARTITLAAGLGETVHVKLNAAGLRALSRLHRLPVTLSASQWTSRDAGRSMVRRFTFNALARRA
ncbi:MAG: large repetitive protein [Solirubrobacteraceae bacterium]|nr:large repetitive protein [Solirubrobacteraceae bacterium]